MVAKRLSDVGGDGQAFRCGGEEFAIVFRNTSLKKPSIILKPSAKTSNNPLSTSVARIEEPSAPKRRAATAEPSHPIAESPQEKKLRRAPAAARPLIRYRQHRSRRAQHPLPSPEQVIQAADQASIAPSTKAETAWNQPPPHSSAYRTQARQSVAALIARICHPDPELVEGVGLLLSAASPLPGWTTCFTTVSRATSAAFRNRVTLLGDA